MMSFFDINTIAFSLWDYQVSYLELVATSLALISVYLATKSHIYTWPFGIVSIILVSILFYQVQLYADVILQGYFFAVSVYGWYRWKNSEDEISNSMLNSKTRIILAILIVLATLITGYCIQHIHEWMPKIFIAPAAFPYADSFVLVASIVAQTLLAQKKIENWHLWIAVNCFAVCIYYLKGINLLAIEYFIFLGMAIYGAYNWKKQFPLVK